MRGTGQSETSAAIPVATAPAGHGLPRPGSFPAHAPRKVCLSALLGSECSGRS